MGREKITPCRGLKGVIQVQGDKSISHRAVILSALAEGKSTVEGFLPADDCIRTVSAFQAMGVRIERKGETTFDIHGRGPSALQEAPEVLDFGNSGTGFRLVLGVIAGRDFFSVLTGDASLKTRPMGRIVEPLREMGAQIWGRARGHLAPLAVQGAPLQGITYTLPVASAQVKSSLLLAGLSAQGVTTVIEPRPTRDHTERMFSAFQIPLEKKGHQLSIEGGARFEGRSIVVPGDLSSSAFFLVAGCIVEGSEIVIRNVGINPTRTGIIEALRYMGAHIEMGGERDSSGEPVADLRVTASPLKGMTIDEAWIPRMIDELPVLCVAAAFASGETVIRGAKELRFKESDRIATMAEGLRALGAEVEEHPDGLDIRGGGVLKGGRVRSHGDHRVAMSLIVAGLAARGETVVEGTECIDTSFPAFMSLLQKLKGR